MKGWFVSVFVIGKVRNGERTGGVVDGFKWMVLGERGKLPMVLTRGIHRNRENNRLDLDFDRWEKKGLGKTGSRKPGIVLLVVLYCLNPLGLPLGEIMS